MKDILFINATPSSKLRDKVNGTMILASKLIDAGFTVDILHFYEIDSYATGDYNKFIDDITDRIIKEHPKSVSFYTLWPFYHILLRISQKIKEKNSDIYTIMGGPQSSATAFDTMKAMSFVDYIATGEGENTVVPFFKSLLRNNRKGLEDIPGLYYRKDGNIEFCDTQIDFCDLDSIPQWNESLYEVTENDLNSKNYYMPIDVGRGCPFNCTFCCTSVFWKRAYRLKSSKRIIEDIKYYNKKFGIKSFMFSHDAFTTNEHLVSEVCDSIIESNLKINWKCTTRADCISEELILKMKKAGMDEIQIGVESGSPKMQKTIRKNLNLDKVKKIVRFLLQNKIRVILFFMYGFPEETEADLSQTLSLYCDFAEMGVKKISMSFCKFNPSTDIVKKNFDDLIFAPEIKVLSRDIFGFDEEIEMFKKNKAIFPFFYHLNTAVRNNYQYLVYFVLLYRNYSKYFKLVRDYYKNDILKMYRDFCNNNVKIFKEDIDIIQENIINNHHQMLINMVKNLDKNIVDRFTALLDYSIDLRTVEKSKEDMRIQKRYAFNYIEYQLQIPIEQFSDCSSELIIEKKNGKINVQIVSV